MKKCHVYTSLVLFIAMMCVSGLPKYYKHTLYKPGGLDHLDATGDESKWGKLVRWILTGQSRIPEKKKAILKGPFGPLPPDVVIKPDGRIKPVEAVLPDGSLKPAGADILIKPDGRIKPIGPFGPLPPDVVIKPNGRIKPVEAVLPDGSLKPAGADILIKPDGRIKPIGPFGPIKPDGSLKAQAVILPDGSVKPPHPLPLPVPLPLPPPPLGPVDVDTVIKPNGRIKSVGPFGPISPDGSVQPTIAIDPDGSTRQVGADVIVKPDGRIKLVGDALHGEKPPRPLGPVLPEFIRRNEEMRREARRRGRDRNSEPRSTTRDRRNEVRPRRPLGPFNPNRLPPQTHPDLDVVVKPNGRIKTVGPFGPISLDGSVQPTLGVNPDGSTAQIGTDVIVKRDGRIKPVAELIRNGGLIKPLGPVSPDLIRKGDDLPGPIRANSANDPFGPGSVRGAMDLDRGPYGYGLPPPIHHDRNDIGDKDAYPYVF